MSSLCDTFRALSFKTWDHLSQSRMVRHQPLEETFTDLNLLQLKIRHPAEIAVQSFTKPQEVFNGADWEWWLTDTRHSQWLGIRVQAKVLELASDTFKHLHYQRAGIYQSTRLEMRCAELGLVPLYCLYLQFDGQLNFCKNCLSYPHTNESYGCSLVSIDSVYSLRKRHNACSLSDLSKWCLPWHCLVCCKGYGGRGLPERAWRFLQRGLGITSVKAKDGEGMRPGPRDKPPPYVIRIMEGQPFDIPDEHLKHILVITEPSQAE